MSYRIKQYPDSSRYGTLKTTWPEQTKYKFAIDKNKEKYGSFSISAAVRGECNACWDNPWYKQGLRQLTYPGVT